MAREFHPSVITLDIHLPDMPGWRILDRLKGDLVTRHIPICVVSTDDARDRALQSGALGFLAKPLQSADEADAVVAQLHAYAERSTKRLAVVMPPSARRSAFIATLDTDVDVVLAEDRESARHALAGADALVVEDTLADFGPEDVLDTVAERRGICAAARGAVPRRRGRDGQLEPAPRRPDDRRGGVAAGAAHADRAVAAPQPVGAVGRGPRRDRGPDGAGATRSRAARR